MLKIQNIIITIAITIIANLIWTVWSYDYSPLYWLSSITDNSEEAWAFRGQIGDILSGHFSAMAVLAVAYSILLQQEANRQMKLSIDKQEKSIRQTQSSINQQATSIQQQTESNLEQAKNTLQQAKALELHAKSIEQQNEALRIQSDSLKAQIEELKEARKESSKQTEEFFINNMNIKLDRFYKLLDSYLKKISAELKTEYLQAYKICKTPKHSSGWKDKLEKCNISITHVIMVLNHIYIELSTIKKKYPNAYHLFLEELSDERITWIQKNFHLKNKCIAFKAHENFEETKQAYVNISNN